MRFVLPALALSLSLVTLTASFAEPPAAVPATVPAARFTVTDLGAIPKEQKVGGMVSYTAPNNEGAVALNDRGQVVGSFAHAFLWDRGHTRDLGTLPGGDPHNTQISIATAINNQGQVVGISGTFEILTPDMADEWGFLYTNKAPRPLTTRGGFPVMRPEAINDAGQIAGQDGQAPEGFFYAKGKMTLLGTLAGESAGGDSDATGINRQGQVVGSSTAPGPHRDHLPTHAFLWQRKGKAGGKSGRMRDLGTLPGWTDSYATAINDRGEVAGTLSSAPDTDWSAHPDFPPRAFLWRAGKMTDLGTLPGGRDSQAFGLNNAGAVVGESDNQAFLWESGQMRDLTALIPAGSGWALSEARAINSKGQIAGNGQLHGQPHAFLLTPRRLTSRAPARSCPPP